MLIALIGTHWLTAAEANGNRRLDNPQDYVRLEVLSALQRKIRVVPVLVQKAAMPTADVLPGPLKPLALHQAVELSETRWDYDTERLIAALGGKHQRAFSKRQVIVGVAAAVIIAVIVGLGGFYFHHEKEARLAGAANFNSSVKPPNDITGSWTVGWTPPQGRAVRIQFNFQAQGDRLMGSVRYPTGEGGIYDGRIEGDRLLFVTRHTPQFETDEVTISFSGQVSGDEIDFIMQRPNGAQRFIATRLLNADEKPERRVGK